MMKIFFKSFKSHMEIGNNVGRSFRAKKEVFISVGVRHL